VTLGVISPQSLIDAANRATNQLLGLVAALVFVAAACGRTLDRARSGVSWTPLMQRAR
jgi:hypothetical protein